MLIKLRGHFLLTLLISFLCLVSHSQQKPYYTQYILNNYILNPALSGIEDYFDIKASYRSQWAGIEGAPVTTYLSIQGPIGKHEINTPSSLLEGENARGKSYWNNYTAPESHSGVGIIVLNDKTGYINRFSVYGTYAYHKKLNDNTALAAGFLGGFTDVSLDRSKIEWGSLDPNDPAIGYSNGSIKKFMPELGAGLWLYSQNYFAGASVLNIVPVRANYSSTDTYKSYYQPQFIATAGYRFFISEDIDALPSLMFQFVNPFPVQVHANIKLQYQDLLWLGASYRSSDVLGGYAAMAGVNISRSLNLGYAYEISTTSRLRTYTHNTNEIVVGFLLNNKNGDSCPRNIW